MHIRRLVDLIGLAFLWAACIYGAVSLKDLRFANDHSICGPWGCGPATSALVALHLGWLALMAPPILYLPRRVGLSRQVIRWLGTAIATSGLVLALGIILWQWFVWLPNVGEWAKPYIWQRCAFAVATAIDIPSIQLIAVGTALRYFHRETLASRFDLPNG